VHELDCITNTQTQLHLKKVIFNVAIITKIIEYKNMCRVDVPWFICWKIKKKHNASKARKWLSSWVIAWEDSIAFITYYIAVTTVTETQPKHILFL